MGQPGRRPVQRLTKYYQEFDGRADVVIGPYGWLVANF